MSAVEFDLSELHKFTADLTKAGAVAKRELRPTVSKSALNIDKQLKKEMFAHRYFKGAGSAISYDIKTEGTSLIADIGPSSEEGSPGNLANIAYFGTSRGGGTVPDPKGALEAEAPNLEKYLLDLVDGLL